MKRSRQIQSLLTQVKNHRSKIHVQKGGLNRVQSLQGRDSGVISYIPGHCPKQRHLRNVGTTDYNHTLFLLEEVIGAKKEFSIL